MRSFINIYTSIAIVLMVLGSNLASSQNCSVDLGADTVVANCGETVYLSAIGLSATPALTTDFNSGLGSGWISSQTLLYSNPCGPTLDGTPAAWFGSGVNPRTLTTIGFDLSCGGQVCFDLDFANDENAVDCEDPDAIDEGVSFQYSIDGGLTWIDIFYFEPNNANSGPYYSWANYCFTLPPGAWTANTMFQWTQLNVSGTTWDHWGIDNVDVTPSNCGYWYDWDNLGGGFGNVDPSDQNVNPNTTTTYIAAYTDGTDICYDTITVLIDSLIADVTASSTNIMCPNCVDLDAQFTNYNMGSIVDDFDPALDATMWNDVQGGNPGGGCGSMTGNALYFDGGTTRHAETIAIDATTCGTLDFCLFIGNTGSGGACENADAGENVELEYTINGGVTWVPLAVYDQATWDANNSWQCFTVALPAAAVTTSTAFKWSQPSFTGNIDNWALDNVSFACAPPGFTYAWSSPATLSDPTISDPQACPVDSTLYTVTITDPANGCSASDSIFINVTCVCMFPTFTANISDCENGNEFTVSGDFEYVEHPGTGTLVVEVTNASGTYTQVFNPPFTNQLLQNYSISGVISDGSPVSVTIYFTDDLACTSTLNDMSPVLPEVNSISGGGVYCTGVTAGDILVDVTGNGPWTLDYTIDGVAQSIGGAASPINLGNGAGVYVLTNISDVGCTNTATGADSIILQDLPTVLSITGGGVYCDGDAVENIVVEVTGTAPWTLDYTLDGVPVTLTSMTDSIVIGNNPGVYVLTGILDAGCTGVAAGTQTITVNPLPNVFAGDDFISCDGDMILLSGSGAQVYSWDNGVDNNVGFIPGATATYTVTGTDANGCVNTDDIIVTVEPLPVISFFADSLFGCEPFTVTFVNTSTASSMVDQCIWTFDGGDVINENCDTAVVEFVSGGNYDVSLTIITINGCESTDMYTDYIYVEDVPVASFAVSSHSVLSLNTQVFFTNTSTGAVNYIWDFGDSTGQVTTVNPIHNFPTTATTGYPVTLYAYSPIGCMDSTITVIQVSQEDIFYIPNSFTPDGDEFNQTWQPVFTLGHDPYDFDLFVFNRWGEIVWESHDATVAWDGTYKGKIVPAGSYTWKIEFKSEWSDERKMYTGHLNVLK